MTTSLSATDKSSTPSVTQDNRPIRVLHVDDEAGLLLTSKQILELQNPFQVETASSVMEAKQKLMEKQFDVIVSDYQMPEKDGLTFLNELRESGSNIPFILFTGKGREEVAIKALNLGADYYANKIGRPETVYSQLSHYINRAVQKRKAEERLKYKLEFESVITCISSRFVNPLDIDATINSSLADMGSISGASRVYLFLLRENGTAMDNTHEWCAEGVSPQIENLQNISVDAISWLMEKLRNGKKIQVTDISLLPPEAEAEKRILQNQNIKSIIVIPVNVSGVLAGLIGFDNVENTGSWSADDVALLQIVSELIGNSLERKKTEKKLKESERIHRLITENITDVVFIQNADLSISYVSPSITALSGYTPEEAIELGPKNLMTPESFERGVANVRDAMALLTKDPDAVLPFWCYEYILKDGSTAWGEYKPKFLRDSKGNFVSLLGILRDVTERKKAEDALCQEREKLELVTGNLKAGLTIISKDYTILWANKFLKDVCGDVTGKTCYSVFNDHNAVCPNCGVKEVFETGKDNVVHEQSVPAPNGQRTWLELTVNSIRDEKGHIVAASELSVFSDERKAMETKLREAEKRYHAFFDKAPLGILIVDPDGTAVEFNDRAHLQLGYSREEFEKLTVADYEVRETPDEIKARMKKILKLGKDEFESKHRTKTGESRDIKNTVQVIELDGKKFFHVITEDITEQKNAEKQLIQSETKYREMINAMNDVVWVSGFDGKIDDVNDAAVEVLGYSRSELLSMKVHEVDFYTKLERFVDLRDRLLAGEQQIFRAIYTAKDGRNIPVEVNTSPVNYAGKTRVLCIARDITERKKVEESLNKMMEEQLLTNEKLSVVGKITRHDARNKLSIIANNVFLAKKQLAKNHKTLDYLKSIESAIDQIEKIFSFARIYEKVGAEDLSYVNVESCVNEAALLFSGINEVKLLNDCSGLNVLADSLLMQLFYNLIDDSLKHGETVSQIRVHYEKEDDNLKLVYTDDGTGVPKKEKQLIFKEGYGKGTGYGLYLIRKLCDAYGWSIKETGTPGKGAQFTIIIPKVDTNKKLSYNILGSN